MPCFTVDGDGLSFPALRRRVCLVGLSVNKSQLEYEGVKGKEPAGTSKAHQEGVEVLLVPRMSARQPFMHRQNAYASGRARASPLTDICRSTQCRLLTPAGGIMLLQLHGVHTGWQCLNPAWSQWDRTRKAMGGSPINLDALMPEFAYSARRKINVARRKCPRTSGL